MMNHVTVTCSCEQALNSDFSKEDARPQSGQRLRRGDHTVTTSTWRMVRGQLPSLLVYGAG